MNKIYIYHGSDHVINNPQLKLGKKNNDYGQGFYCTEEIDKAKEWSCKDTNGYINKYELSLKGLRVLDLTLDKYSCLNWVAVLLKNRTFNINDNLSIRSREYIINNYLIDTSRYDVIIGYRADDSYFKYASAFIENSLPLSILEKALKLGQLGTQIVLVSNKAFKNIKFISSESVDFNEYHNKHMIRDANARNDFEKLLKKRYNIAKETYAIDLIRKENKHG